MEPVRTIDIALKVKVNYTTIITLSSSCSVSCVLVPFNTSLSISWFSPSMELRILGTGGLELPGMGMALAAIGEPICVGAELLGEPGEFGLHRDVN
jgi:hypothetical protein